MTTPKGVPREFYDDVVRQRDAAVAALHELQARYAELSERALGLKAQEMGGALPSTFRSADPTASLGPKTQLAIDAFAQGDPELRNRLIQTATLLMSVAQSDDGLEDDELDAHVAKKITEGDR